MICDFPVLGNGGEGVSVRLLVPLSGPWNIGFWIFFMAVLEALGVPWVGLGDCDAFGERIL